MNAGFKAGIENRLQSRNKKKDGLTEAVLFYFITIIY